MERRIETEKSAERMNGRRRFKGRRRRLPRGSDREEEWRRRFEGRRASLTRPLIFTGKLA